MSVSKEFFGLETYAIYAAMSELFGKKGWDVVWRSGEIAFADLKKNLNITESDPLAVMKKVTQYIVESGYVPRLDVKKVSDSEYEYHVHHSVAREAVTRLRKTYKDPVLPHFSTTLLVAALKEMCSMKAEIVSVSHGADVPERGFTIERWKVSKMK